MVLLVFVSDCYFHTSWCCLFWVWRKCTGNIASTLCKYTTIHMQVKYERSWDTMYHHGITVNNFFQEVSYTWTFTGIYMYHKNNFFVFSCLDSGSNQYDAMQLFFMVANHQTINDMFAMYRWKSNRDDPYTVSLNRTIFLSNAVINHGWWQGFAWAQQDFLIIPYNGSERLLLWSWQLQPVVPAGR